jgi:uncharacterized protein
LITGVGTGALAWLVTSSLLIAVVAVLLGGVLSLLGLAPLGRHIGRYGGWGGTSGGWGRGGGSWGGGGFRSGGGGDFGGGGASGRW